MSFVLCCSQLWTTYTGNCSVLQEFSQQQSPMLWFKHALLFLETSKTLTAGCQSELRWRQCSSLELSGNCPDWHQSLTSASEPAGYSVGNKTSDRERDKKKKRLNDQRSHSVCLCPCMSVFVRIFLRFARLGWWHLFKVVSSLLRT